VGHVIVVEDDEANQALASRWLTAAEIPHEVCGSAEVARSRISANGIAVAVVDVGLPGEDGKQLSKWIAARHSDILVVLWSGRYGALTGELKHETIPKPIDAGDFVATVRNLLWRHQVDAELSRLRRGQARMKHLVAAAAGGATFVGSIIQWILRGGN